MFTWLEAAVMCEELYGAEVNMKEGYFVCPSCGEVVYECDWREHDDWEVCPVCEEYFCDDREDSAE